MNTKKMKAAIFDIETTAIDNWSTLDGLKKAHCLVVQDENNKVHRFRNDGDTDTIPEGLELLSAKDFVVAHNGIGFDIPALFYLYGFSHARVVDTMVLSRLVHPDIKEIDWRRSSKSDLPKNLYGSHSLGAWGYRLGVHKDSFGKDADWASYSKEMEDYCVQDVKVTKYLFDHLMELAEMQGHGDTHAPLKEWVSKNKSIALEMAFAQAMRTQEENGFPFNAAAANELTGRLAKRRATLQDVLHEVFPAEVVETKTHWWIDADGNKFATKKKMMEEGYKAKECIKGPLKTKEIPFNPNSRDQIASRLIAAGWKPTHYEGKRPAINESVLREINTEQSLTLLEYLLLSKRLGQLSEGNQAWIKLEHKGRIHGSVNTNGAVSGRCTHMNPNIAQVPSVLSEYGADCRALFTAPAGKVLVGADASGLELRMLASYLSNIDGGSYAKKLLEGDIHETNREAAGLPDRPAAKRFIYAFLYGAGDSKIGEIVGGTSRDGRRLRESFYRKIPAIKTLSRAVQDKVQHKKFLVGLDGRHLPCRSVHSALNLLLQSAGAVVMKFALIAFVEAAPAGTYEMHANVHDEVQFSCDEKDAEKLGQLFVACLQHAGKILGVACPLDGEYKVGKTWADTH